MTNKKQIKDLNLTPEAIKLLEENIGSIHVYTGLSNIYIYILYKYIYILVMFPKARETTVKINKMGLNEVKNLLHREKNYQQSKTGHLLKERKHLQTMSLRG